VFQALRDVSFEVRRSQVVGIIGRNGAGKSTLLKIITGKLDYNEGSVDVSGRGVVHPRTGNGVQPEYTGRENIYLGGILVGLTARKSGRSWTGSSNSANSAR